MSGQSDYVLFAGSSHPELAQQIADCLKIPLGKALIEKFPDGEIGVRVLESVRGRDVFIVQSTANHPNFYLMELLIFVDALKRASARSIVAVMPYFGYARQDRRGMSREPITARLVADLLQTAGVTSVLTMDLHTEQIQGFFNIPVDNLYALPLLVEALPSQPKEERIVVAPDVGSIKLARLYAQSLKVDLAIIDKRRVNATTVDPGALIGDVKGKEVLLVDDVCSTGKTLSKAAFACLRLGAARVRAIVTHGLFADKGLLEGSEIEQVIVSNTVPLSKEMDRNKFLVVSVAPLLSRAIESMVSLKSISSFYLP
jgi:ribose-phosphate pyrophosphokinase